MNLRKLLFCYAVGVLMLLFCTQSIHAKNMKKVVFYTTYKVVGQPCYGSDGCVPDYCVGVQYYTKSKVMDIDDPKVKMYIVNFQSDGLNYKLEKVLAKKHAVKPRNIEIIRNVVDYESPKRRAQLPSHIDTFMTRYFVVLRTPDTEDGPGLPQIMEPLFEEETKKIEPSTLKEKFTQALSAKKKDELYQKYLQKLMAGGLGCQEAPAAVFGGWVNIMDIEAQYHTAMHFDEFTYEGSDEAQRGVVSLGVDYRNLVTGEEESICVVLCLGEGEPLNDISQIPYEMVCEAVAKKTGLPVSKIEAYDWWLHS